MRLNDLTVPAGLFITLVALSGCSSDSDGGSSNSTSAPVTSNTPQAQTSGGTVARARMVTPRGDHTATKTPQGVVAIGGESAQGVVASIEVYRNGRWESLGSLSAPRKGHTATLLPNGQILVAGGQSDVAGKAILNTTELVDPATGQVTAGPQLFGARSGHAAVALATAQGDAVLLAGGASTSGSLNSAELYDVASNQILPVQAPMVADRVGARAIALPNGEVLIQGGVTAMTPQNMSTQPAGAELFDPATRTFAAAGTMGVDRYGAALALSDAGAAVAIGGNSQARLEATVEAYDASANTWSSVNATLSEAREDLTATALPQGGLLLVGGGHAQGASAAVERFVASPAPAFTSYTPLKEARSGHTATRLDNGRILVTGGFSAFGVVANSEEYDPQAQGHAASIQPQPPATTTGPGGPVQPGTPPTGQPAQNPARVLAILPDEGKPGDIITIAGSGFAKDKDDNMVVFQGGATGKVLFEVRIRRLPLLGSVETLLVEVPQGVQTGPVTVFSNGVPSANTKDFTLDPNSGGDPRILYTLPRKNAVGDMVTIFGRNFARPAADNIVRFAPGVRANLIGGITTQSVPFLGNVSVMLVRVPQGAQTGDLTVEANGRMSNGYAFEVEGTQPAASGNTGGSTGSTPGGNTGSTPGNQTRTFFAEDFEGQTLRFTQQGGLWQASQPAAGPARAASGTWAAGTAMQQGRYAPDARGYLISQEIDLTQATTAELSFSHYLDTDGVDAGRILVSPDGGTTLYLVRPRSGYGATGIFSPAEGFTGGTTGWTQVTADLTPFAGNRIIVVFDFKADGTDQRTGWYLDDVAVTGY